MGTASLDSARAKLSRANEHLDVIEAVLREHAKASAHIVEIRRDGVWHVVMINPPNPPPMRWAAMVGDAINNMRAALDHAVWQLILREDNVPGNLSSFPIFTEEEEFLDKVKSPPKKRQERSPLYGIHVDGDAWTIIERAQPFHADEPYVTDLAIIARMSNIDKHRSLVTQLDFPSLHINDWVGWRGGIHPIEQRDSFGPLSLEEPTEVCRFRFADPDPGVYVKGEPAFEPTFGDFYAQVPWPKLRSGLWVLVNNIIEEFCSLPRVQ